MKKSIFFMLFLCLQLSSAFSQICSDDYDFPEEFYLYDLFMCFDPGSETMKSSQSRLIHNEVKFHFPNLLPFYESYKVVFDYDNAPDNTINVPQGGTYTFIYPSSGPKRVRIKVKRLDQVFATTMWVDLLIKPTTGTYAAPDDVWDISLLSYEVDYTPSCNNALPPELDWYNDANDISAHAYIRYADGRDYLVKPIIFVDGLDLSFKVIKDPDTDQVIRHGGVGWDVLMRGASKELLPPGESEIFAAYPATLNQASDEGYDIIFLDFERGADFIQRNAQLLKELILRVNEEKQADATGKVHENIVIGASMGGQIARYCLAKMEKEGDSHCTHTYVSFDSPHIGANISLGTQSAAWFAYATDFNKSRWVKLNSPAPLQLTTTNLGRAVNEGDISIEVHPLSAPLDIIFPNDYSCLRDEFVQEREDLGYPESTRNIAISCGSGVGINQGYGADKHIFDVFTNINLSGTTHFRVLKLDIFALNGGHLDTYINAISTLGPPLPLQINLNGDDLIFNGALPANKTFSSYYMASVKVIDDLPTFDNAPGCYRTDMFSLHADLSKQVANQDGASYLNNLSNFEINQAFIPTMSTLDIDWAVDDTNLFRNILAADIIGNNLTPFDAYYAPNQNLKHVQLTAGMSTWIFDQLPLGEIDETVLVTIPNSNGTTYNHGRKNTRLSNYSIESGGTVYINKVGNTKYGNGVATENNTTVWTSAASCQAPVHIDVKGGGAFILGSGPNTSINNKGVLTLMNGSSMHIYNGGKLRLQRGSQVVIQSGASLTIDEGANIDLWWYDSSIHIEDGGELIINGEFKFTGSGFFQFDENNLLTLNSDFILEGTDSRFIQINKNATLNIGNRGLDLRKGEVVYQDDAKIRIEAGGSATAQNVIFTGTAGSVAISSSEATELFFSFCTFNNHLAGIYATKGQLGQNYFAYFCEFNTCGVGIWLEDQSHFRCDQTSFHGDSQSSSAINAVNTDLVLVSGGVIENFTSPATNIGALSFENVASISISSVDIENNKNGAILEDVPDATFSNVTFSGNEIAAILIDATEFKMNNTEVRNSSQYGIYVPSSTFQYPQNYSNIFLRGGTIFENNTVGIQVDKGGQVDGSSAFYGRVLMDCAKMIHNGVAIRGEDVPLEIDALDHSQNNHPDYVNPNTFIKAYYTPQNPEQFFNICYTDLAGIVTEVFARSNYWEGGLNAGNDYILQNPNSSGNCEGTNFVPLNASSPVASEPANCLSDDDGPQTPTPGDKDRSSQKQESIETLFLISPNPAHDQFSVSLGTEKFELQIFNALGVEIYQSAHQSFTQVDAANWPKGIYLIKVKPEGREEFLIQKLIVQ